MGEKILKFNDVEVNKEKSHAFRQAITVNLADIDKIVISLKFKHSDIYFINILNILLSKYFIGYKDDNIIRPL